MTATATFERKRQPSLNPRSLARKLGGVIIAIGIWEVISVAHLVKGDALASPLTTLTAIRQSLSPLGRALGATLQAWSVGLAIAIVAGIVLGTFAGRSRIAEITTEALVRMMRPLPSPALIPIAILVAGLGLKMTAGLVAFASFWPIFINARYGVHQVDTRLLETAEMLELKGVSLWRKVIIPAAAPLICSGIQVSVSLALVVTVSVELVAGTGGLGQFVLLAQQANQTATMYGGIVIGGVLGWILNLLFAKILDLLVPWRNQRAEVVS